jgi:hypothetical protein
MENKDQKEMSDPKERPVKRALRDQKVKLGPKAKKEILVRKDR